MAFQRGHKNTVIHPVQERERGCCVSLHWPSHFPMGTIFSWARYHLYPEIRRDVDKLLLIIVNILGPLAKPGAGVCWCSNSWENGQVSNWKILSGQSKLIGLSFLALDAQLLCQLSRFTLTFLDQKQVEKKMEEVTTLHHSLSSSLSPPAFQKTLKPILLQNILNSPLFHLICALKIFLFPVILKSCQRALISLAHTQHTHHIYFSLVKVDDTF